MPCDSPLPPPQLCDLYETDSIFDKFECSVNGAGSHFVTGSYDNAFSIYDVEGRVETTMEVRARRAAG